jgi:hypothetical protein
LEALNDFTVEVVIEALPEVNDTNSTEDGNSTSNDTDTSNSTDTDTETQSNDTAETNDTDEAQEEAAEVVIPKFVPNVNTAVLSEE